jgi:hypothetical protein
MPSLVTQEREVAAALLGGLGIEGGTGSHAIVDRRMTSIMLPERSCPIQLIQIIEPAATPSLTCNRGTVTDAGRHMPEDTAPLSDARAQSYAASTSLAPPDDHASHGGVAATHRAWLPYAFGALAVACAGAALFASYVLSPRLLERIPDGWSWHSSFVGHVRQPDAKGEGFDPPVTALYARELKLEGPGPLPGTVRIADDFTINDVRTGKVIWRYTVHPIVDRRTGAYAEPKFWGEILLFPRNVERTIYVLRQNYVEGYPVRFIAEDKIEGLTTYLFEYVGSAEYTSSYRGTADYPGVNVTPDQEVKCADDGFYLRLWVEPLTGATVKVAEGCESGDYLFDVRTRERLQPVLTWSGETEGAAVLANVERARRGRLKVIAGTYLAPALAGLALVFGVAALLGRRKAA